MTSYDIRLFPRDGRFWAVFLFALLLPLLLFALPSAAQETAVPEATPNAANGLNIFAARCANCHGPFGQGDGELAVNLPAPPRDFTDPEWRRTAVPGSFYSLVFNGNLDAGMPGFGQGVNSRDPLTDAEIWDALAAVMTLATPGDVLAAGEAVYAASCASCHGDAGAGDGPEAATAEAPIPDLTDLAYWYNRSNEVVFVSLEPGKVPDHDYELSDDELWQVVDYARTFSYGFAEVAPADTAGAVAATLASGVIRGQVINGTTGALVGEAVAQLRGFTSNIEQMLTMTTTVAADGSFAFDLADVPQDWVYLVGVQYGDLTFSSEVAQLTTLAPEAELPVTVYDTTTNADAISLAQVHIVMDFLAEDVLQVTELYVFMNAESAVFIGAAGDPDLGVVQLDVPAGAQNLSFERAFAAMDNFVPASEVIQTADGYADTIPLRPGRSTSSLVVNYTLPYDGGVDVSHALPYAAASATVMFPDAGVELVGESWQQSTQQTMGGAFRSYSQTNLPAGTRLSFTLEGEPEQIATAGGSAAAAPRSQSTELIVGAVALLVVGGAAFFVVRARQAADEDEDAYEDDWTADEVFADEVDDGGGNGRADDLIQAIADLDDAFERGDLDEAAYRQQREQLKQELKAMWAE
ncbi:MAG: c-type cytochrome [Anaerolineales bacterium]|nr:c-type cytochrome [Anaerolineales bacterium]